MYIIIHTDLIAANEPQLGSITDRELIEEPDEGRDAFIEYMADNQCVESTCNVIDTVNEEDITLELETYFNTVEIDLLNEMFMTSDEWTECQIELALDILHRKDK